jgi:hypothetical protein
MATRSREAINGGDEARRNPMSDTLSRRELIRSTALAGGLAALGGIWTEESARAESRRVSPNAKLNTAHIGVGGQGGGDLGVIGGLPNVNVVAL